MLLNENTCGAALQSRPLEFIHFVSVRPVRDGMNLARHFSAGTSKDKQISPVGTTEWSPHG